LKFAVVVTEAAERDINAAAVWYEGEAAGLGREFLDALAWHSGALRIIHINSQSYTATSAARC
jgi:hypothetical protein